MLASLALRYKYLVKIILYTSKNGSVEFYFLCCWFADCSLQAYQWGSVQMKPPWQETCWQKNCTDWDSQWRMRRYSLPSPLSVKFYRKGISDLISLSIQVIQRNGILYVYYTAKLYSYFKELDRVEKIIGHAWNRHYIFL